MAGFEEALLDRRVQAGRLDQPAAAADQRDGVAVLDQRRGRLGRHELVDRHRRPQITSAKRAAPCFSIERAMTVRWISDVPSKMRKMRASR